MKFIGLVGYKQSGKTTVLNHLKKNYKAKEIMLAGHLKDVCSEVFDIPRDHFDDQNIKEEPLKDKDALFNIEMGLLELVVVLVFLKSLLSLQAEESFTFAVHFTAYLMAISFFAEESFLDFKEGFKGLINKRTITLDMENMLECLHKFEIEPDYRIMKKLIGKELKTPREVAQIIGSELLRDHKPDCHIEWAIKNSGDAEVLVASDVRFPNEFDYFAVRGGIMIHVDRQSVSPKEGENVHQSESHIKSLGKKCHIIVDNNKTLEALEKQVSEIKLETPPVGVAT